MPSWIVPSDSHVPGDQGHATDHDRIADDLTLLSTAFPVVSGAAGQAWPGWLAPAVVPLTQSGGSVAVNASLGNVFTLTLTASGWTIANPAQPADAQTIWFRLTQDSTGGRSVSWGSAYDFGSGSAPGLTATAWKTDIVAFQYIATVVNGSPLASWAYLAAPVPQGF